ncbi:methionine ABC transporter ATP-binding protein [Yimella sp. cx-51]|uniref:methionine ABC transporter ATP-binding protein n=1 Tax=Yimella sp. cx-51 TaxID=2770551 RepID=UPI00165E6764|nr:methionine ABC transporter ATP-binding protein [Yimella sp. cx-51]
MSTSLAKGTGSTSEAAGPIIRLDSVRKVFTRGGSTVTALDDLSLQIGRGEVFAVIGFSGAGKSTLVRLINALETPTEGSVVVDDNDLTSLNAKQIRAIRSGIGMVFQQFNLMRSRTVYGNVAYPLETAGWSKQQIKERVTELLHFVGLTEKAWAYPDELSGGQKQRIGIARALATRPPILLADESTSALDPDTTREVLALLRRVNEEMGVTIVVITHEMDVVRTIADRVAVLEGGRLIETGTVQQVFTDPQHPGTRRLVGATLSNIPQADDIARLRTTHTGRLATVTLRHEGGLGAVLGRAQEFGVQFEIVHGGVTVTKGESLSTFTLALQGDSSAVDAFLRELESVGSVEEAA